MSTATKVAKHYFKHNNIKYFRTKAENVELGTFGIKKDPVGAIAYLSPQNTIDAQHLAGRARYLGRIRVDWASQSKADVEANGKLTYLTASGTGQASADFARARTARLELLKFGIDAGDLIQVLNHDAGGARGFLNGEQGAGRVASEIFVAVDAEIGESFANAAASAGSVAATLTKALGLEFEARHSGNGRGTVTVTLSPGTTFAYGMHKVDEWERGKVVRLEDDRKGMG